MRNRILLKSFAGIFLALALSCSAPSVPQVPSGGDLVDHGEAVLMCNQCRWKDTVDGGNDAFNPGCHQYFQGNAACAGAGTYYSPDICNSPTLLSEWTDSTCHAGAPLDRVQIDCDKLCKDNGKLGGRCVTVQKVCDGGKKPAAKCECDEITAKDPKTDPRSPPK